MDLMYQSTRGGETPVTASEAILKGLAGDGGLFVPVNIPKLDMDPGEIGRLSYRELAFRVMKLYLTDFTDDELRSCIDAAYDDKFDTGNIAELRKEAGAWYLELFHGATIAFKDMALSILPHLMTVSARKNHLSRDIVILTATSGDTGKAALSGFADVPGTKIIVFYPKNGVSRIQELQMVTQKGSNTYVVGITGNFDDAQSGVKALFSDTELRDELDRNGFRFSSANSINIGRLVPQIVYYVYAYGQLVERGAIQAGDPVNVTVPTGNFGNILAAFYAKKMGLPISRLICASNENKVLYDFFSTGTYDRRREFVLTTSPSMDILISSNLERLIFMIAGENAAKCRELMENLSGQGFYSITEEMKAGLADFCGGTADEKATAEEILRVYNESGYVIDPHTAVASSVYHAYRKNSGDTLPTVIASTASPYKFAGSVMDALGRKNGNETDMELIDSLSAVSGTAIPRAIEEIRNAKVLHDRVIDSTEMKNTVRSILLG